jgi:hypothetical protein
MPFGLASFDHPGPISPLEGRHRGKVRDFTRSNPGWLRAAEFGRAGRRREDFRRIDFVISHGGPNGDLKFISPRKINGRRSHQSHNLRDFTRLQPIRGLRPGYAPPLRLLRAPTHAIFVISHCQPRRSARMAGNKGKGEGAIAWNVRRGKASPRIQETQNDQSGC